MMSGNKLHIISRGTKWAVIRSGRKRAMKIFHHRDIAYHFAMKKHGTVIVHNKDGSVCFVTEKD